MKREQAPVSTRQVSVCQAEVLPENAGASRYSKPEEWRKVVGFEDYSVSSFGRVRRDAKGKGTNPGDIVSGMINRAGYRRVFLSVSGRVTPFYVHRLVASCFVANCGDKPHVNHVDGDKLNNNSNNLEWCTPLENSTHAACNGLLASGDSHWPRVKPHCLRPCKGESNARATLTDSQVLSIRSFAAHGFLQKDIAEKFNVSVRLVSYIVSRQTWRHI